MPYQVETSTVPFLIVTISYLVVLGLIGWWGNRQNRNLQDFFTMSGSAGAVLSGLAYFSTQYSMSTFMGVPGSIYHVGYAGMSVSVPAYRLDAAKKDLIKQALSDAKDRLEAALI